MGDEEDGDEVAWGQRGISGSSPVHKPTDDSVSLFFSRPEAVKKPTVSYIMVTLSPSTIFTRKGVHRFAASSSESIA